MNRTAGTAQLLPAADLAAENLRQLFGVELSERVARVKNDRQAIDGDDLLGVRAFQVAQTLKIDQLAILYRPR